MKKKTDTVKLWHKNTSILFFILVMLVSFVLINATSGLFFSNSKVDLTHDRRYSLTPQTENLLSAMTAPVDVKIYLSNTIAKRYPVYAQYAQYILHFLDQYQQKSDGLVKVEVINPEPFSTDEDDAKRAGLQAISLEGDADNHYFGAIFSNYDGQTYTIPYFSGLRKNYLENDLTRAIAAAQVSKRRTVGVASAELNILNKSFRGRQSDLDWTFIKLLGKDYNIESVSTGSAEIPYNIDTLILVTTRRVPALFLYAMDQFLLRGGRLLIFIDPLAETENVLSSYKEDKNTNVDLLLSHWGIDYQDNVVVGDNLLAQEIPLETIQNGVQMRKYAPWMKLTREYLNEVHALTEGLNNIMLKSPGILQLHPIQGIQNTPLFITSRQTMVIDANVPKFGSKEETLDMMEKQDSSFVTGVLSEGMYRSAFQDNPLRETEEESKMLPYLSSSLVPGKAIVIADSDLLFAKNWAAPDYDDGNDFSEIVPINNNFDFIQRAVDYLSGNPTLMAVGDKAVSDRSLTLRHLISDQIAQNYVEQRENLRKEAENNLTILNDTLEKIKNQQALSSVKTINDINQLRRKLQQSNEDLRRLDYQIRNETEQRLELIASINTLLIPLLLLLFFAIVGKWASWRSKQKAMRLLNEQ